jgi:hypothetical protein
MTSSLIVDGMLSGTGLRDPAEGGYVEPSEVGLSSSLRQKLKAWLLRYEDAHYHQYEDGETNRQLDLEGLGIAKMVKDELPNVTVRYFSSAYLKELDL